MARSSAHRQKRAEWVVLIVPIIVMVVLCASISTQAYIAIEDQARDSVRR